MDMINSSITALNALAGKISPKVNNGGGDLDSLKIQKENTEIQACNVNVASSSPPAMVASVVPTEVAEQVLMTGLMSEPSENGSKSGSPTDTTEPQPDTDTIKMFVGQVPRTMDENELRGMFEEFGPVYQINVLRDKITGQSKGCCFVTFYTRKAALEAQNAMHNIKTLPGMHHPIQMKPADTENRNERKLFVGMVSKKFNESDVRVMFNSFGTIEECTVLRDTNGVSKGCAFVTFSTRQCAINAIKAMHHSQTMEGCSSPLVVKFADTQKEKEQKKVLQLQNNLWSLSTAPLAGVPAAAAPTPTNLITPQYLTALQQLQALNGFASTQVTTPQPQQPTANPYQGAGLSSATTATAQPASAVNLLTLQQLLAANGTTNLALANGAQAVTSTIPVTAVTPHQLNPQQQSALTSLYTLSNGNGNTGGTMTTQAPTGLTNGASTGTTADLSALGLTALPTNFTTNPLGLTSLGSLATLTSGLQAYQGYPPPSATASTTGLEDLTQTSTTGIPTMLTAAPVAALPTTVSSTHSSAASAAAGVTVAGLKQHEGPEGANLFIYHLPQEFTDSDLLQTFNPFGAVISAKVFIDKQTNLSKCFGFVSYDNSLSAQAAIQAMNGFQVGTKRLKVQLKRSKDANKPY